MAEADEDVTIPRAALNKMMKEILPHVRVASDARELILNCCTEFVHLVSSEANEICNKQSKKTISPEHVLDALESLGFGDYLTDCKSTLEQCKTVAAKKRRGSNRLENLGIPEEELLRQQQELFEKARLEQAAIEHQEWLQLQAAQMQQEPGQYFVPGTTGQLIPGQGVVGQIQGTSNMVPGPMGQSAAGQQGVLGQVPGVIQEGMVPGSMNRGSPGMLTQIQSAGQPGGQALAGHVIHQPWVDRTPSGSQTHGPVKSLITEGTSVDTSSNNKTVSTLKKEFAETEKSTSMLSSGQSSLSVTEPQSSSTVVKSEPSD